MVRLFLAFSVTGTLLLFIGACSSDMPMQPRPIVIGHMDLAKKQAYIERMKSTLKNFYASACDLHSRDKFDNLLVLNDQVANFVDFQVMPLVKDFEAENNLETRLELAKLQFLSALIYVELEDYREAKKLLRQMEKRYEPTSALLATPLERYDIGFASLQDGLQFLRERIANRHSPAKPSPAVNPLIAPRT